MSQLLLKRFFSKNRLRIFLKIFQSQWEWKYTILTLSSSSVFLLEFNELSPTVLGLSSTETVEMNRSDHSKNSGLDLSALAIEDPSSSLWPLEIASAGDQLNIPIEEHKYFLWDQIKDFAYQQKSLLDSLGRYTAGLRYNSRLSVSRIKYVKQSRSILTTDAKYKFVSFPDRNGWIRDSVFIMVPSGYKSKTLDRRTLSRSFSGRDCTIYTCASRRGYKKPNLSKGNRRLGLSIRNQPTKIKYQGTSEFRKEKSNNYHPTV